MALVVVILLVLAMGVGVAGWVLARPSAMVASTPTTSQPTGGTPSGTSTADRAAEPTPTARRTVAASGLATIPADLTLPHEDDLAWQGVNLTVDDCAEEVPRRPDSLRTASDVRTVQLSSSAGSRSESLVVATDQNAAATVVSEIAALLTTCATPADDGFPVPTYTTGSVTEPPGQNSTEWTRTALVANTFPQPDGPDRAQYVLLAQSERAVIVGVISGENAIAPKDGVLDPATVADLQSFADEMAPKLCPFTAAGCQPPAPDPATSPIDGPDPGAAPDAGGGDPGVTDPGAVDPGPGSESGSAAGPGPDAPQALPETTPTG